MPLWLADADDAGEISMLDLIASVSPRPKIFKPGYSDIASVSLMVTCAFVLLVVPPIVIVPVLLTFICALADKTTVNNTITVEKFFFIMV